MLKNKFVAALFISTIISSAAISAEPVKTTTATPATPVAKVAPPVGARAAAVPAPVVKGPAPAGAQAPLAGNIEQRKAMFKERADKWAAMNKADKVKFVNTQHDTMIKNMQDRWTKMSDDEKIAQQQKSIDAAKANLGL